MKDKRHILLRRVLLFMILATLAFIWGNSMLGKEDSSKLSNKVLDVIEPALTVLGLPQKDDTLLRKLAHFAEFALLGTETFIFLRLKKESFFSPFLISLLFCTTAAGIDEFIQSFTGRFPKLSDILLDSSGATAGIILGFFIYRRFLITKQLTKN